MLKKVALWFGVSLVVVVAVLAGAGVWVSSLMMDEDRREGWLSTQPSELSYIANSITPLRGRILVVVTSTGSTAIKGKNLGYELTELSRAYYVFKANGFEVDVASTQGGEPKMVIDGDDMGPYDYAFLNDAAAREKITHTIPVNKVDTNSYAAVYFVGGKGTLFDFPNNIAIQTLVRDMYEQGKVVAAVCHGPAAWVNVTLSNGEALLAGKQVTAFTNEEELFLMPNAKTHFPFLLESEMRERNARFFSGPMYLDNMITDGNLISGQNPWSVWRTAETIVSTLGYTPAKRELTAEERAVIILMAYQDGGSAAAEKALRATTMGCNTCVDRNLIAMHALVATMQGKVGKTIDLLGLVKQVKKHAETNRQTN